MVGVKFITLGTLKESYLREAAAEYEKRLGAFCKIQIVQLKEERLSDNPGDGEIRQALDREAAKIMAEIPTRATSFLKTGNTYIQSICKFLKALNMKSSKIV